VLRVAAAQQGCCASGAGRDRSGRAAPVAPELPVLRLALRACISRVAHKHQLAGPKARASTTVATSDNGPAAEESGSSEQAQEHAAAAPQQQRQRQDQQQPDEQEQLLELWLAAGELSEQEWQAVEAWVEQHGAGAAELVAAARAEEAQPGRLAADQLTAAPPGYLQSDLERLGWGQACQVSRRCCKRSTAIALTPHKL
jgi:hypothetical protein